LPEREPFRVAVLVSGEGTNLQSLIDEVHDPAGPVRIVLVVASRDDAGGLRRAEAAGIATGVVRMADHGGDREARDRAVADVVERARPDLVVLAGWMSILTGAFLDRFADRVINLHPSMLPAFPGMHAIEEALAWGCRWTGVTVHYVEEQVDAGPPVLQEPVPVLYGDTAESLRERIRPVEHRLVPEAVRLFAAGRVRRDPSDPRRVEILDEERR
jgi:formyltetrahydrofolate-dependent phosphoribosylglycinamide formyltransferase